MTTKKLCIAALCIMSVIFVLAIVGYFIFRLRVKRESSAVRVKRLLPKNSIWWLCCWLIWVVSFLVYWRGAKLKSNEYDVFNFGTLSIAGILLTILLFLNFFVCKYSYITSQKVYQPNNFGLSRNKKKIMYKISGSTLKLWFNNAIMPKEYAIIEDGEKLEEILKENYKLNKLLR